MNTVQEMKHCVFIDTGISRMNPQGNKAETIPNIILGMERDRIQGEDREEGI